jgi:hypothetical protein
MKLILCSPCNQIFNLSHTYTECKGAHGGGQYVDDINAKVWGPREKIFVLGFANGSLVEALRAQLDTGDSTEKMPYAGRMETKGRDFTAFIIPESASSVERVDERFEPVIVNRNIYD